MTFRKAAEIGCGMVMFGAFVALFAFVLIGGAMVITGDLP